MDARAILSLRVVAVDALPQRPAGPGLPEWRRYRLVLGSRTPGPREVPLVFRAVFRAASCLEAVAQC